MRILLISQYKNNIICKTLPQNATLHYHFKFYHLAVYNALILKGHQVVLSDGLESDLESKIIECDVVFSLNHDLGYVNSDLFVKLLCQKHSKSSVGNASFSKFYDTDKIVGKLLANKLGILTPDYCLPYQLDEIKFKPKYLLKPRFSASSEYINDECIFDDVNKLKTALYKTNKPEQFFIEQFIDGVTVTIGCLLKDGNVIFSEPYMLISKSNRVITYTDKKQGGTIRNYISNPRLVKKIKNIANTYFLNMQPCQIARLDFMLSKSKQLYFLEVNTTPNLGCRNGFTTSFVDNYFESYADFINYLVISAKDFNR